MSGCHDWGLDLWLSHWVAHGGEGDREQISEGWTLSTRRVHFVIRKHASFFIWKIHFGIWREIQFLIGQIHFLLMLYEWRRHWLPRGEGDREQISEGWTLSTRQVHFVIQKHAFFYIFTFWDLERNAIFNWTNTFLTNIIWVAEARRGGQRPDQWRVDIVY